MSMFNLSYVILVNMVLTAIVSGTYRDIGIDIGKV
jgi:hypothetical protein